jgi:NAD(P)-dependent dehydrogenase (short-subunit alcohol dehydrogenase family)
MHSPGIRLFWARPKQDERYPLKRPAHVHEITDLIVFLASYRSGYTSGTIFTVDGGIAVPPFGDLRSV